MSVSGSAVCVGVSGSAVFVGVSGSAVFVRVRSCVRACKYEWISCVCASVGVRDRWANTDSATITAV